MENLVMPALSHVEFRPMFDMGDYCVTSSYEDAEYYAIYCATPGEPASRDAVFDDPADALAHLFSELKYRGATLWYNGNEIMQKIEEEDDVFHILTDHYDIESDKELHKLGKDLGIEAAIRYVLIKHVRNRRRIQA